MGILILGIDAHKRTHTAVAIDQHGRPLGRRTTTATGPSDHLELVRWADTLARERIWAVEDCRTSLPAPGVGSAGGRRADRAGPAEIDGPCP
jgi:hypothetical protein